MARCPIMMHALHGGTSLGKIRFISIRYEEFDTFTAQLLAPIFVSRSPRCASLKDACPAVKGALKDTYAGFFGAPGPCVQHEAVHGESGATPSLTTRDRLPRAM